MSKQICLPYLNFDQCRQRGLSKLLVGLVLLLPSLLSADFDKAVDVLSESERQGVVSQQKIDHLDEQTRQAVFEYRALLKQNESLEIYAKQLQALLKDQSDEMTRKEEEIVRVKSFEREIIPLITRMVVALGRLLDNDIPFLLEERRNRVQKLNLMMAKANINIAEKFRRVLEAYQIEVDYGRNIETYRGQVRSVSGEDRTVNFLRVGRNVLIYETLDGSKRAVWDRASRQWQAVPDSYSDMIRKAIRIARKQAAPDLLILPLAPPEVLSTTSPATAN